MADVDTTESAVDKSDSLRSDTTDKAIPYERFKSVNDQLKAAKEELRKREEAEKKALEQKEIEEGKLKEVLQRKETELAELRKSDESHKKETSALRDSYINALPDEADRMAAKYIPDIAELKEFVDKKVKPGPPFAAKTQTKEQNLEEVLKPGRSFQEVTADLRKLGLTQ